MGCGGLAEITMTDENELEAQTRRKFLKTTGAVGAAATTGVAAFGGQAAAQNLDFGNVSVSVGEFDAGLVDLDVTVSDIDVTVSDIRVIVKNNEIVKNVDADVLNFNFDDIRVANANQVVVIVQALSSGGNVVGVKRKIVQL